MSTHLTPGRPRAGFRALDRNIRQLRSTTRTIADAAGLRLAVCPPPLRHDCDRDLGTVVRDAYVGETVRIPVKLQNRSGRRRAMALAASALRSDAGPLPLTPSLSRSHLDLPDGQTGLVVIEIEVTDAFTPGARYTSVVAVTSRCCGPQDLRVCLRVQPDSRCTTVQICCRGTERPRAGPCGPGSTPR